MSPKGNSRYRCYSRYAGGYLLDAAGFHPEARQFGVTIPMVDEGCNALQTMADELSNFRTNISRQSWAGPTAVSAGRRPEQVPAVKKKNPSAEGERAGAILAENWPTLATAMGRYEQNRAEAFTRQAYDCVFSGLIRLEDRQRLSAVASDMGIRPFDAQLLIACAVRQWSLDHIFDTTPDRQAPKLSAEYRNWSRVWLRFGIVAGLAITLDWILLWNWLR